MSMKLVKQRRLSDGDIRHRESVDNKVATLSPTKQLLIPNERKKLSRSHQNLSRSCSDSTDDSITVSLKSIKIAILGDMCVGKSALTVRFITKRFITEYSPTLEAIYSHQEIVDNQTAIYDILDTAGNEVPQEGNVLWADGFICMYSVIDRNSFEIMKEVVNTIAGTKSLKCPCIIVGNKTDLTHFREVSYAEGEEFATSFQHLFAEISVAEDIEGVGDIFSDIYRRTIILTNTKKKGNAQVKQFMNKILPKRKDYPKRKERNKTIV